MIPMVGNISVMGGVGFQPWGRCLGVLPGQAVGVPPATRRSAVMVLVMVMRRRWGGGGLAELRYADKIFTISHTIHGTFVFVNLHEFV